MRGCKCAISTKAARKSLPSRSSSVVLCFVARAGHVSRRTNTTTITIAAKSAISVNASGHDTRARFDREWRSTNDERRSNDKAQTLNHESNSLANPAAEPRRRTPKNYRPPRPMGVKGGCSPQNNLKNLEASKRASSRWQQKFL